MIDFFFMSMKWCKLILGDMNEDLFFQGIRGSVFWVVIFQQSMVDGMIYIKDMVFLFIFEMVVDMMQVWGIFFVFMSLRCVLIVWSYLDGFNC